MVEAGDGPVGLVATAGDWGDVDLDGDEDLVLMGLDVDGRPVAELYLANSAGQLVAADAGLPGVVCQSVSKKIKEDERRFREG